MYIPAPRSRVCCGESERERKSELGLSDAARGLVYSRASDDNVHAALNLPLLPPSSRELGRGGSPPFFSSFLFTFALYHIPFLPSYVPECCVALRSALLIFFRHHHFLSLLLRLCRPSISFPVSALILYAPVSPLDSRRKYNSRDTSSHGNAPTRRTDVYVSDS